MAYQIMTLKGFINEVRMVSQGPHPRKFCFVLGAGASKTSGIKTGEELVEIWERELAERNSRDHEEWKHQLGITEENRGNFYSDYYQRRFPRDNGGRYRDGYNYLEQLMDKARPSGGYVHLALIMANTTNNVVVTTNFDHLVEDSLVQYTQKMPMVIGHEKLAPYATEEIARPTVVKIHRDLLLNPINKPDELNKLHNEWVKVLDNLFSHYHPVFIGYAGNDNSVMDFLCNNVDKFNSDQWAFPYWLIYGDQLPEGKVGQFLEDTNGYLISHRGFDQVMVLLSNALGQRLPSEEEYIKKTQDQYTALMDSVSQLLEEQLPDGPKLLVQAGGGLDAVGIEGADEGNLYSQYLAFHTNGEYEKALVPIRRLVEQFPDKQLYHYSLGIALRMVGQYEEALEETRKAIELEPKNPHYHNSLAISLHEMKKYEEAEAEVRKAIELEPENARYHNSLAVILHSMERYEEALEERRRAVTLEPENARYHDQLGVTLYEMKRYSEAADEVHKAIELEPENADFHHSLAVTLHAMKRYEEALEERRRAVTLEPENARYHNQLGVTLHDMERYEEAEAEKRRAIELEPENAYYHNQLGVTLHEMKKYEEAEAEKRKAVEQEPGNADYHNSLGITQHEEKKYEEAEAEKRKAIELEPTNARYHDSLSTTLHEMKRYEEAAEETRKAIELEPTHAQYHDSLSTTLHEMKRYEEAVEETRKAIELDPENPDYYDSLAITLRAMGQEEEAAELEKKAEELRAAQSNT